MLTLDFLQFLTPIATNVSFPDSFQPLEFTHLLLGSRLRVRMSSPKGMRGVYVVQYPPAGRTLTSQVFTSAGLPLLTLDAAPNFKEAFFFLFIQ